MWFYFTKFEMAIIAAGFTYISVIALVYPVKELVNMIKEKWSKRKSKKEDCGYFEED